MDFIKKITIDQWITILTGGVGGFISLLDFIGAIDWPLERLIEMILLGVGILMVNIVVQAMRQETEISRVEEHFGGPKVRFLRMEGEVPDEFEKQANKAKRHIREAVLSWVEEGDQRERDNYRNRRDARIRRHQVVLSQIVIIHHKQHFREVLGMLAQFGDNNNYYKLFHFTPPSPLIPTINLWLFDDEHVYAGSVFLRGDMTPEQMLYTCNPQLVGWFDKYWQSLLTEARHHRLTNDKEKLRAIGKSLATPIDDNEFEQMWSDAQAAAHNGQWVNAVLTPKTRLRALRGLLQQNRQQK